MGTAVAGEQAGTRSDVGTREFQITAALTDLLTGATAVDVAPVAMLFDLGFGNISHEVVLVLAGRLQIVRAAVATRVRMDVVFEKDRVRRRVGSNAAGV